MSLLNAPTKVDYSAKEKKEDDRSCTRDAETKALLVVGDCVCTYMADTDHHTCNILWDSTKGEHIAAVPTNMLHTGLYVKDGKDCSCKVSDLIIEQVVKTVSVNLGAVLNPVIRLLPAVREEWTRLVICGYHAMAKEFLQEHTDSHTDSDMTKFCALRRVFEYNPRTTVRTCPLVIKTEGIESTLAMDAAREIRTCPEIGSTFVAAATIALFEAIESKYTAHIPKILASRVMTSDPCFDTSLQEVSDTGIVVSTKFPFPWNEQFHVMIYELPSMPLKTGVSIGRSLIRIIDVIRREVWCDDHNFVIEYHNGVTGRPLNLVNIFSQCETKDVLDKDTVETTCRWSDYATDNILRNLNEYDPTGWERDMHSGGIKAKKNASFLFLFTCGNIVYEGAKRIVRSCVPRMMEKDTPIDDKRFMHTKQSLRTRCRTIHNPTKTAYSWSPIEYMSIIIPPFSEKLFDTLQSPSSMRGKVDAAVSDASGSSICSSSSDILASYISDLNEP